MKSQGIRLLSAALVLALAGCGGKEEAGKKLKLAFVTNNGTTFWTIARAGCEDAEKALGNVDVDFRIPSTGGAGEQQQILDDLVAKGVDGIAVSPIDPTNQTGFLNRMPARRS